MYKIVKVLKDSHGIQTSGGAQHKVIQRIIKLLQQQMDELKETPTSEYDVFPRELGRRPFSRGSL